MSRKKTKRKVRIKGIIRSFVLLSLISLFIFKLIQWNFYKEDVYYNLEYGEIEVSDIYKALVVRKEIVSTSKIAGNIIQVAIEGEKVKKNQKILDITSTGDLTINSLDIDSESFDDGKKIEINTISLESVEFEIAKIKEEIAFNIKNKTYDDIEMLRDGLSSRIETLRHWKDVSKDVVSTEIAVGSSNLLVGESEPIYADVSGILTYYLDGFESDLTYEKILRLDYDQIELLDINPEKVNTKGISEGDPLFKIIDDSSWYLIIMVENGKQNEFDENKLLEVQIGDRIIKGYIELIFSSSNRVAIAIKFTEVVEDFHKVRFMNAKITQDTFKGLKILKQSLVEKNSKIGVLVVDKYKNIIFKPVNIIKEEGIYAIVKEGSFYKMVNNENTKIDTVNSYDNVIIDPTGYSDGDILD